MHIGPSLGAAALSVVALVGGLAPASASTASSPQPAVARHRHSPTVKLPMQLSAPALQRCFPHARASVTVELTTEKKGFDTVKLHVDHLRAKTTFTVFLIEQAGAPFGAAEYIGDFTTDRYGHASISYRVIAEEAFAFNNVTKSRTDLNSVGFWFADPLDDDDCVGAGGQPTGFDGDASAGVQVMNSGATLLP